MGNIHVSVNSVCNRTFVAVFCRRNLQPECLSCITKIFSSNVKKNATEGKRVYFVDFLEQNNEQTVQSERYTKSLPPVWGTS